MVTEKQDRIRNEDIGNNLGGAPTEDKMRENLLRLVRPLI